MRLVLIFFFFNKMKHNILVPRAAIILPSATDQVLRGWFRNRKSLIADFRLSAQPQEFETISLTKGYKNGTAAYPRTGNQNSRSMTLT